MERRHKFQLAGWLLFTLCAVCYIISAGINRDMYSLTGGLLFFIACFVFLVPLFEEIFEKRSKRHPSASRT